MTREDVEEDYSVSRETLEILDLYVSELRRWQTVKNLVGPGTLEDIWGRHIADSLQLYALAPASSEWLDLGSGAGLPGLVIAAYGKHAGIAVTLVEANSRKCSFLRETARRMSLPVTILEGRIESVVSKLDRKIDVVTARALAPLTQLIEWAYPLLTTGAIGIFPKGADASIELTESRKSWRFNANSTPSRTDPQGRILTISSVSKAPPS
jgi:16S rRNA (guanine527-N7)-methyltransferase